jgi:hypothetical protein
LRPSAPNSGPRWSMVGLPTVAKYIDKYVHMMYK